MDRCVLVKTVGTVAVRTNDNKCLVYFVFNQKHDQRALQKLSQSMTITHTDTPSIVRNHILCHF